MPSAGFFILTDITTFLSILKLLVHYILYTENNCVVKLFFVVISYFVCYNGF